jgi:hypothetical protein
MSDIKKFLRFEISGYVAILYVILYCIAFFDFTKITIDLPQNILNLSVSGFIIAAPIGFLMHQLDISFFSPFKKKRMGKDRNAICLLETYTKDCPCFKDIKPQVSLEIIKCLLDKENIFNYSYFEKEISNRYSYYYSRLEAGAFAPFFGFIIFIIISGFLWFYLGNPFFSIDPIPWLRILFILFILAIVVLISVYISIYCRTLLEEIDGLECLFKDLISKEFGEKKFVKNPPQKKQRSSCKRVWKNNGEC